MKKYILILTLLGTLVGAHGQGVLNFANYPWILFAPPDRLVRFAPGVPNSFGTNNAPLVGTNYFAQLYLGAPTSDESSLTPVGGSLTTFWPQTASASLLGTWQGRSLNFGQYNPGDVVKLQVRVWDSTFADTYEAAGVNGIQGKSIAFLFGFEFPVGAPNQGAMINFQAFTVSYVPEPSSQVLAGLGATLLLLLRRRNRLAC